MNSFGYALHVVVGRPEAFEAGCSSWQDWMPLDMAVEPDAEEVVVLYL